MSVDLRLAIVRILKPDGDTVGTGFVTDSGLIATCPNPPVPGELTAEGTEAC